MLSACYGGRLFNAEAEILNSQTELNSGIHKCILPLQNKYLVTSSNCNISAFGLGSI